jgi:stearoyl-CoA desaturase (delta-9 desaturase)
VQASLPLRPDERLNWRSSVPFFLAHLAPVAIVFTGVTAKAVVLGVVLYVVRMFLITAGYHRYFAHRSFKVGRVTQFLLAFGGTTAAQKGPLWWAANHRIHHRESDTEADVHTPLKGFWHSHVGWILADRHGPTDLDGIRDFAKFPELRFLNKHDWIGPWSVGILSFLIAGWSGLVVGFFCSTIVLWHATFTVNSLAHVFGRRRYATTDTSRNSLLIALITGGEGWHNNHHHYQASARQGFFWWEIDMTYYGLRALSLVGIVRELKQPTAAVKAGPRVRNGAFDVGMFRASWTRAAAAVSASREAITGERDALERHVASSLAAAESYAKSVRRRSREAGVAS